MRYLLKTTALFDEDDIMRTQGQGGITSRTEEIAERLQDKLDERDHVDEDMTPEEDIRGKEEEKEAEYKGEETENVSSDKEQLDEADIWNNAIQGFVMNARRFAEMRGLLV